jgi:predicted metal-dependent hydrolase
MEQQYSQATFGSRKFDYEIRFSNRTTMEIAVLPDCQVVVTAPYDAERREIEKRVSRRLHWISKQVDFFQQFQPRTPERQYISGETHLYLGRQYRLKVVEADTPRVKMSRGYIRVETLTPQCSETTFKLLDEWYFRRAQVKLVERFELCFEPFVRKGYEKPRLVLRKMKARWGSLSPSGVLLLNRDLIRAPLECIDYVLIHELCHLRYADHGKGFYRLMENVLPDWEKRKHRLEIMMV